MFQTRHYWKIAGILEKVYHEIDGELISTPEYAHEKIVEGFVRFFTENNPNFKPARFIAASKGEITR